MFIGNLGTAPENRYTAGGDCVTTFSIGVSDDYTKDGQRVEQTDWVRVVAWRKLGENCAQYLRKGSKVFVSGKMKTRSWEQDGVKKYVTEIIANDVQFLDTRREGADGHESRNPAQGESPPNKPDTEAGGGFDDETIPF